MAQAYQAAQRSVDPIGEAANGRKRMTLGLVLAGGQSRRMGRDKAAVPLAGRPLARHALDRLSPQVTTVALNARCAPEGLPENLSLVPDIETVQLGPLAGVLAGLRHAAERGHAFVATVPVDAPFFPTDLVARLSAAITQDHRLAVAATDDTLHPVFALWPASLADDLAVFLHADPKRRVRSFLERHHAAIVTFPSDAVGGNPFLNLNTPEDLARAERILALQDRSA